MSSLNKSADARLTDHPFVAEGGVPYSTSASGSRDPFEALDDLMCVIEALAPVWPPRDPMREGKHWLL
jgi:hypothetical protein